MKPAVLLAFAVSVAACSATPQQDRTAIEVTRVEERFGILPSGRHGAAAAADAARLVTQLQAWGNGRMDVLHVSLPQGLAAGPLRDALEAAGVRPRKITLHPVWVGSGLTVVAGRDLAQVPPCPVISLNATGFGSNEERPGLGCADLANLAATSPILTTCF